MPAAGRRRTDSAKPPTPARKPPVRHHQRAIQDRGAATRARLVEAALDSFGRLGFEGASTREIAKAAKANLAAIAYHFGSKEALHVAVAEHIIARIMQSIGPVLAGIAGEAATATPARARALMQTLLDAYVDVILGNEEAERWARFIVREQMQPSPAFNVIYGTFGRTLALGRHLVAVATGRPDDEETGLRTIALFGQALIFRVAQAIVLRQTKWTAIRETGRAAIKAVIHSHLEAILGEETIP